METIFNLCVYFLSRLADLFGTSYEVINVWIFCIIGPVIFLGLFVGLLYYRRKYRYLFTYCMEIKKNDRTSDSEHCQGLS